MSITVMVENDTIKLPMHVPDGTKVKIILPGETVSSEDGVTLYERMKEFVGCIKDGPEDLATEHDHCAHGAPKRDGC